MDALLYATRAGPQLLFLPNLPSIVLPSLTLSFLAGLLPATSLWSPQDPVPQISWFQGDFDQALKQAKRSKSWLVIHFWAEWSEWSQRQKDESLNQPEVIQALQSMTLMDVEASSPHFAKLNEQFKPRTFPTLVFVRADGKADEVVAGFMPAVDLVKEVERVRKGQNTLTFWEHKVQLEPQDLEARYNLGNKKWDLGDDQGYFAELEAIRAADPEGKTLTRRRIDLRELQEDVYGCRREGKELHLEPLLEFLAEETYDELLWEGWRNLAGIYEGEELKAYDLCRQSHRRAWKFVPADKTDQYALEVAWTYYNHADKGIKASEKRFALKLARDAVRKAGKQNNALVHSQGLYILAHCQALNGQMKAALSTLQEAVRLYPDDKFHQAALDAMKEAAEGA
ncbi:MAG: hypothetical protein DWQ01_00975 [Planctomycetota bacterium]|nr:MAG: hypothetical protein DWQ01_00975 [Planctomycetota bacterium]